MALPASDSTNVWPPKNLTHIFGYMAQWSAWYSNDLSQLQAAYGGGVAADNTGFFASDSGGFKPTVGQRLQRWFVGQRTFGPNRNTKMPVPIAAMICEAMADLLFADAPTFTLTKPVKGAKDTTQTADPNASTQARLNELADDSLYDTLARATELAAALGGSYLRVVWDESVIPDRPFIDVVDADQAIPEFRWGRLVAVTFWSVVARDGQKVWRHLERHETDAFGNGVILHGLYEGEEDKLGDRVSLDSRVETQSLATLTLDAPVAGQIDSLTPGLCVEYLPNRGPNRLWRTDPVGRYLGRSSLDGIEHLMDQLAETLSDWMRARRAAKARVWFDKNLTSNPGPGQGAVVDLDQDVYTGVNDSVKGPNVKMSDKIEVLQPTFNPDEYATTAQMLIEQILQLSGFSLQTFGMDQASAKSADTTATEIESRERRTFLTRGRQIRTSTPHLARIIRKLLAVDKAVFGTPNVDMPVWIEFPDSVQESMLRLSQTAQTLFAGQSGSLLERVKLLHPDWNDDMWDDEVAAIKEEFAAPIADPMSVPSVAPPKPGTTGIPGTTA